MIARFPQEEMCTQWVIPEVGKRLQYLFSVCRPTILHHLEGFFSSGGRDFRGFVQYLQTEIQHVLLQLEACISELVLHCMNFSESSCFKGNAT